jgi:hypothetical protein
VTFQEDVPEAIVGVVDSIGNGHQAADAGAQASRI